LINNEILLEEMAKKLNSNTSSYVAQKRGYVARMFRKMEIDLEKACG
jgi:hypothetical protein